jgi:ribosome-associated protein
LKLTPIAIARAAGKLALSKKGYDIRILKLKDISSICDYFVIASGDVDVHVRAIAEAIDKGLMKKGIKPWHKEGLRGGKWILLDYVDVVIHIFHHQTRHFYALEKLWGDAPIEALK